MIKKINKFLSERLKFVILKDYPRHSVRFAKKHFNNKEIVCIEIDTFEGFNAKIILKELNVKRIYLIDPYEEYSEYIKSEKDKNKEKLSKTEKAAKKRLKKYSDKILWIKDYSNNAIKKIKEKVDFIYIDGNHEYKYVKEYMNKYWPIVKKGGIMAGHDIASFRGVGQALIEFCSKKKIVPYISRTD
ncbi:MAG: class I SAM-dependent methyltransferase [Candidatus Pacearchaeota archaeon]